MKYDWKKIGDRIRKLRKDKGWTQQNVIDKINERFPIGRNKYIALENGKDENYYTEVFTELCMIYHCDIGYLLCEYDTKFRDRYEMGEMLGLSETAINILTHKDNSRGFVNAFLEYPMHYEIAQTVYNYCKTVSIEKEKAASFRNAAEAKENAALIYGERAWAIDEFTNFINSLYDPSTGTGIYQTFLETYEKQQTALIENQSKLQN